MVLLFVSPRLPGTRATGRGDDVLVQVFIEEAAQIENGSTFVPGITLAGHTVSSQEDAETLFMLFWWTEQTVSNDWTVFVHMLNAAGEIVSQADGSAGQFSSGISSYPKMGCIAHRIRSEDLGIIYKNEGASVVKVGHLTQDRTIDAKIDVDRLLSRHFAVVGTTGVGKSTSVTLVLRKIIKSRPDIRVLMLDPHNEFATAFPEDSVVIDAESLVLPFWLFKLDELSEVIFRGQSGFDAETEILGDLIPLAKERYRLEMEAGGNGLKKRKGRNNLTADTPVPYRLADLVKLIDDRLGFMGSMNVDRRSLFFFN